MIDISDLVDVFDQLGDLGRQCGQCEHYKKMGRRFDCLLGYKPYDHTDACNDWTERENA